MLILIAGMAIGVIFGRRPITGSCGGIGALGIDAECEICGGDPKRCDAPKVTAQDAAAAAKLSHRADAAH